MNEGVHINRPFNYGGEILLRRSSGELMYWGAGDAAPVDVTLPYGSIASLIASAADATALAPVPAKASPDMGKVIALGVLLGAGLLVFNLFRGPARMVETGVAETGSA